MEKDRVVGIDLGGTSIRTALCDREGAVLSEGIKATLANRGEDEVLHRIFEAVEETVADEPWNRIACIGMGAPGPVDAESGSIITTPNLPFRNFSLTKALQERFGVPAHLDNDASVAALGEHRFGAGKGVRNMIYMTISTGVGGGCIIDGDFYSGTNANAMEIGHMIIDKHSPYRCNCGRYGDVEALCSGRSIERRAKEAIAGEKDTMLRRFVVPTTREVHEAYLEGDHEAIRILEEMFDNLGLAIANLMLVLDPELVVLGGGVTQIGELFFDKVRLSCKKYSFAHMYEKLRIVPSMLGQDTSLMGAVALGLLYAGDGEETKTK